MKRVLATGTPALLVASLTLVAPSPVDAQIPERFANLQVIDADISRPELIEMMRSFSFALGVRCSNCHAVSDGLDDPADDFASDARPAKDRAREMLRMVRAINERFLAALPERREPNVAVTCMTCHRGVRRPELLESVLFRVATNDGIDAAMARYQSLRERFYGRAAYDFGPRTLFSLGEMLVGADRPGEAIVVFRFILEDSPDSAEAWLNIGAAEAAAGNREAAITAYRRVIEINPDGGWASTAQRRIAELVGGLQ